MYKERNLCLSCRAEVPERSESRLATHLLSPVPSQGSMAGQKAQGPGSPGKSCCHGGRRWRLGSLHPLPAVSPPACQVGCQGQRQGIFQNLLGREDVILHLPGFWEDLIKIDMFPVCFNVLDFAVPDRHARKFLTSCTMNTERQQLSALTQSVFPISSQRNLGANSPTWIATFPRHPAPASSDVGSATLVHVGSLVTVPEGWTPDQGAQRRDVVCQPLLYACSSRQALGLTVDLG